MLVIKVRARFLALALIAALAACSAETANKPLANIPPQGEPQSVSAVGYRPASLASNDSSPQLLVLVAFSGGGKGSAAFSYGVLRGLRDFRITIEGRERRLLDEVDTIAAVSGGSFPAAYYGLHRDKIFTDFERDFLKRDIDDYVWGVHLLPWRWKWRFNPAELGNWQWWVDPQQTAYSLDVNEEMGNIYDELMFHGATYADLTRSGKPFVLINATDVNYGTVFAFSQDMFDLICSDLSSFPIALAVAASNGYPLLFSPITLENHARECAGREPAWLKRAELDGSSSRDRYLAAFARKYRDPSETRYAHLMDGGIADPLGMRYIIGTVLRYGDDLDAMRQAGFDRVRRIILISADAVASANAGGGRYDFRINPLWRQHRVAYPSESVLSARRVEGYNAETLVLAKDELKKFVETLRRLRCEQGSVIDGHPCEDVEGYLAHLSFADIPDSRVREELEQIPIALTMADEEVDKLVSMGEMLVRDSATLAEFRRSLEPPPTAAGGGGW
jgi:NTE family protein